MSRLARVCRDCRITVAPITVVLIGVTGFVGLGFGAYAPNTASERQPSPFNARVRVGDWPQLGRTPHRNNVTDGVNIPTDWDIETGKNIKWSAKLGSQTFGNVVVANGKIYVGTNNASGYLKRFPPKVDLGVLLCFRESDGEFLWQYSAATVRKPEMNDEGNYPDFKEKAHLRNVHDLLRNGISSSPVVEGDRLWFVTNHGEVVCLDTEGFRDDENDGSFTTEQSDRPEVAWEAPHEADVVWSSDMRKQLGVRGHYAANCSPTIWGDVLFVCASNGVDGSGDNIPAPNAPSFVAMDKNTGKVLWTDNSPGKNILDGQWSSPAVGVLGGVPQVLFAGGDGWLYSFRADRWNAGIPEPLWKFDGNPKDSIYYPPRGADNRKQRSTRNGIVAVPVIYDGLVYLSMGQTPVHGDGPGHLWCIDPTRRGDVSSELVVDQDGLVVPHQRFQATAPIGKLQPSAVPNPNSAVVWHYDQYDQNGNGKTEFDETMHRSIGSPAIQNDILFIADFSGLAHCLNAKTGRVHWTCDTLSACWASPLIVGEHVYLADEDGDVAIFCVSPYPIKSVKKAEPGRGIVHEPRLEISMQTGIFIMPVVANNVLYIATKTELFAIEAGANGPRRRSSKPDEKD